MAFKLLFSRMTFAAIISWSLLVTAQPFQVGHITLTFTDASRDNRNIATEIYYPSDQSGNNTEVAVLGGAFPVLAFGHGFVMGYDAYENIWSSVVPQGFIMAFPKTEGGILPSHLEFAKDLNFVLSQITALGQNQTSIFYNRIGNQGLMGHSMGGGAAILAAQLNPSASALVVLSAAETNPSAIAAAGSVSMNSLVFAGSNDCVTPPNENQLPMYNALTGNCKTYISITGGSHCQMADNNFLCSLGEATCSPSAEISREAQHAVIDKYLANWLAAKLKSDCSAGATFETEINNDSAITFETNCVLCDPLTTIENWQNEWKIYPNPFSENIVLDFNNLTSLEFSLYDTQSRKVFSERFDKTISVNASNLSSGIYYYDVRINQTSIKKGKLLKQ